MYSLVFMFEYMHFESQVVWFLFDLELYLVKENTSLNRIY